VISATSRRSGSAPGRSWLTRPGSNTDPLQAN
jgi:hypothetical protein